MREAAPTSKSAGVAAEGLKLDLEFQATGAPLVRVHMYGAPGTGAPRVSEAWPGSVSACAELLLFLERWIVLAENASGFLRVDGEPPRALDVERHAKRSAASNVRHIHYGSPFEIQVGLATVGAPGLAILLYTAKRLWGFDLELKTHREQKRIEYLEAVRVRKTLEQTPQPVIDGILDQQATENAWDMRRGEIDDDDSPGACA